MLYGMKERHTSYSFLGNSSNTVDSSCYVPLLITPTVRKWALNGRLTGSGILKLIESELGRKQVLHKKQGLTSFEGLIYCHQVILYYQ